MTKNSSKDLPNIPAITAKTAKNLRWKTLKYLIKNDAENLFFKKIIVRPRYVARFLKSICKKKPYNRNENLFFYGISSINDFKKAIQFSTPIVGFSYCQKPISCPSGRFCTNCINDQNNKLCKENCFIGKSLQKLSKKKAKTIIIPTTHYIGKYILDLIDLNPKKPVIFLITACELALTMFGDYGNTLGLKGIGIKLNGRICNTMEAFTLAERGIKPGQTLLTNQSEEFFFQIIDLFRD